MGQYLICEYDKIAVEYPEFKDAMDEIESAATAKADDIWSPRTNGGLNPATDQYGQTTPAPNWFSQLDGTTRMTSFVLGAPGGTGWQYMLRGTTAGAVDEDIIHFGIGFLIKGLWTDPVTDVEGFWDFPEVKRLYMEIGKIKYGEIDIEAIIGYRNPVLIIKEGFVAPEKTKFSLKGYYGADVGIICVPIGGTLYKTPDMMVPE